MPRRRSPRRIQPMTPRERRTHIAAIAAWWDAEVGERPESLESAIGSFLTRAPVAFIRTALQEAVDKDSLEDSEAVLEAVRDRIRKYAKDLEGLREEKAEKRRAQKAAAKKPPQ